MAKVNKGVRKSDSLRHRVTPYPLGSCCSKGLKDVHKNKKQTTAALEKKEWEDAICSVCLEFPHNAVLLLCSSYRKGCRPYMCATSDRYSNCLDQYKKAYTKVNSNTSRFPWDGTMEYSDLSLGVEWSGEDVEVLELLCPLCRGQVKGWTVVQPARKCLNKKKRTCMQDTCSFLGTYKQLRKHVKAEHPRARPREVDPSVVEKWKKLENETEENDVMSTILSTMPGAVVVGDYVIDRSDRRRFSRNYDGDDYLHMDDVYSALEESYRGGGYDHDDSYSQDMFEVGYHSWDDQEDGGVYRYDSRVRSARVNNYVTGLGRRHGRASTASTGRQQRRRGAGNRHIYFT